MTLTLCSFKEGDEVSSALKRYTVGSETYVWRTTEESFSNVYKADEVGWGFIHYDLMLS